MTKYQIEQARNTLPDFRLGLKNWSPKDYRLYTELNCIEMINSCLTYGSDFWTSKSYTPGENLICDSYIRELGRERVEQLYEEQKDYFDNYVEIVRGTYTDCEGVTYNSLKEPNIDLPTCVKY